VNDVKKSIRTKAHEFGFDAVGFAAAEGEPEDARNLDAYLKDGRHGDMTWMETTADRRADPRALWPEARSIVSLGMNYGPASDPLAQLEMRDRGAISVYAKGRDYHTELKKRLKQLARWMTETCGGEVKVFTDTAPLMEKPVAMRAGVGWIGKHTNLVSRRFGSWLFLGEVLTTLPLPPDAPETDHCGSCDRCIRACPTGALPEPYRIDPNRCISYLTIEQKGTIDAALGAAMANRVYGCDDCVAVCPWNKYATPTAHEAFAPRPGLNAPRLLDLVELDDAGFRALFAGSAIKRTGRDRFVRNALISIVNSGNRTLIDAVRKHRHHPSALVRDTACQTLDRLDND
jgi:epoxyqueuosine reductase